MLIHKARGPYTGMLDLPGGSLEDGERLEETLSREVLEETGCIITSCHQLIAESILFDHIDAKTGEPARLRHVGILYHATTDDEPSVQKDGQDSDGATWLPLTKIDKSKVTPFIPIALKAYVG